MLRRRRPEVGSGAPESGLESGERTVTTPVGINGFGRIGRMVFRILYDRRDQFTVVGVNDLGDAATMAHLLRYDSTQGRFDADVKLDGRTLVVGGLKGTVGASEFNKAVKGAAKALSSAKAKSALWALNGVGVKGKDPYWKTMTSIGALNDTFYAFNGYKSTPPTPATLKTVALHADARSRANVARAVRHGQAAGGHRSGSRPPVRTARRAS